MTNVRVRRLSGELLLGRPLPSSAAELRSEVAACAGVKPWEIELLASEAKVADDSDLSALGPGATLELTVVVRQLRHRVVAWGDAKRGGSPSPATAARLDAVVSVASTDSAFAALLDSGAVVAWGDHRFGGKVQDALSGVVAVRSTAGAFAALRASGAVVCWGSSAFGGDPGALDSLLRASRVVEVASSERAFAALTVDGAVLAWGPPEYGGEVGSLAPQLTGVRRLFGGPCGFLALRDDGAVCWGDVRLRRELGELDLTAATVAQVCGTRGAFAVRLRDGNVRCWGSADAGGDPPELEPVASLSCTGRAFAALLVGGRVVAWGDPQCGGDASTCGLCDVVDVVGAPGGGVFAARTASGALVTWGEAQGGGDAPELRGVRHVVSNGLAFAAIKEDGGLVTWGLAQFGGDSSSAQGRLQDVRSVSGTAMAFAALLSSGAVVCWGHGRFGGSVPDQLAEDLSHGVVSLQSNGAAFLALKPV